MSSMDNSSLDKLIKAHPELSDELNSVANEYTMTLRHLTHEIGNALTLINCSLQIIESSHPEVSDFKYWNSTIEDVNYLKNMLSELSLFNNSTNISLSATELVSLTANVIESFSSLSSVRNHNITFVFNASSNSIIIDADSTKLKQALINIIKNAIEAMSAVESSGVITVSITEENNNVIIAVTDTGCGISPEHIEDIFKPMITYKSSGTGLGLPICAKIIGSHGGNILVSSIPDKGSTFTIELPAKVE